MKPRMFFTLFFISVLFILIAFPILSYAVTFPITYEGTVHVEATITPGGCQGDQKMKITLNANGTLTGTTDYMIFTPGPNKTACSIGSGGFGFSGTHDKVAKFTFTSDFITCSGDFNDEKIIGTGSGSMGYLTATLSFDLPLQSNCPVNQKIPIPVGQQTFATEAPISPVIGLVPSAIKPLGLGDIVNDKTSSFFKLQFCSFDGPVDIYLAYVDAAYQIYCLGPDYIVKDAEHFQAWKTGVNGPVNESLDSSFGGLFPDPGRLPKGINTFYVLVVPSGNATSGFYLWALNVNTVCENIHAGYPEEPQIFLHEPVAVPVYSSDPAKMKPLALGPVAVGGNTIAMYTDFCSFGGRANLYFGLYCDDDLNNLYLLNFAGKEDREQAAKSEILEKVPLASFAGFSKPFETYTPDNLQNEITAFFLGSTQNIPKGLCIYFVAVADDFQPATKFYMWGTLVEFNIRNALIEYWWTGLHPATGARTESFHTDVAEKMVAIIQKTN